MGKILEMTSPRICLTGAMLMAAIALSACGNDQNANAGTNMAKGVFQGLAAARKAKNAPPTPPLTRADLAAFNQPIIKGEIASTGLTTYFVPSSDSNGVQTWRSAANESVSFRNGVLIATRGFGPDIMQSSAPSAATLASGAGSHDRSYFYLDGADQTQRIDYRCVLSNLGAETITVVERQHSTRHVQEQCSGKRGNFTNDYWFENGNFVRKSNELLVSEWGGITFSRVIDKP